MKKQWVMATVMAASSLGAHAATFSGWDLNGSSTLVNNGSVIRLTDGVGADVGTAWLPGAYDLSNISEFEGTKLTIDFDYKASAGGDALALVLTSGGNLSQSPQGALGLTGVDDGLLFVLRPGASGAGTAVIAPGSTANGSTIVNSVGANTAGVNLLASTDFSAQAAHARLIFAREDNAWTFLLQIAQPGSSSFEDVAYSQSNNLSSYFSNLGQLNIGFSGSSLNGGPATFDIVNVSVNTGLPFTPAVPEPGSISLMLAGLGLVGWMASRRKRSA